MSPPLRKGARQSGISQLSREQRCHVWGVGQQRGRIGVWLRLLILTLTSCVLNPFLGLCFCVFKMGINLFSMSVSPDMGREEREERERCIKTNKNGIIWCSVCG